MRCFRAFVLSSLLIAFTTASFGCGRSETVQEKGLREGEALYDLVEKTHPQHSVYELDHQLIVRSEDPARTMALLDLKPGEVVGDIGCGSGFYTYKFSEAVGPTGQVWAIDIQQVALDYLKNRLVDEPIPTASNIRTQLTRTDDPMIPPSTLDAALLSHSDFYAFDKLLPENERMLKALYTATKAGGRLVVIQDMTVILEVGSSAFITRNLTNLGYREEIFDESTPGEVYARYRKP